MYLENHLVQPGHIDRESVRRYVADYTKRLEDASLLGENVHQMALDQQDKVDQMTATWNEEDRLLFSKLYIEEMTAYANEANDRAARINAQAAQVQLQNAQAASNVATWISIIVFFGFLIFMINLLKG